MNTNHVSWLLRQEISGEAGVSLDDKLDILRLSQFAETTTSLQLWAPVALLASFNSWADVSIPAFFQWSVGCSILRSEETKPVIEAARHKANISRFESIQRPVVEGIDVSRPAGFNQLADSITEWAGMLLEGKEFDAETEQCRFEIAVQSCRSQAKLLEEIAAGKSMEAQAVGGNRYNFVFLLQTLWFAFHLKSDSALRRALFHSKGPLPKHSPQFFRGNRVRFNNASAFQKHLNQECQS